MSMRSLRIILYFFITISSIAVGAGLLITLCLKSDNLKSSILPFHPDYTLGQSGIDILENMQFSQEIDTGKVIHVGVLDIDSDSWPIMIDFLQSEIAFLKSERNNPNSIDSNLSSASQESSEPDKQKPLVPINWDRIKTVYSTRVGVMKAGEKPITPPYRLFVSWPKRTNRGVYDFYSFKEFRSDMDKMLANKVEYFAILISIIGFFTGLFSAFLKRYIHGKTTPIPMA